MAWTDLQIALIATLDRSRNVLCRSRERIQLDPETGCFNFHGNLTHQGYGRIMVGGKQKPLHRVTYEAECGSIPAGLVLDHLCRNTRCCNPYHLEPVTDAENIRRGVGFTGVNSRKTHCKHGHEFTPENTRWEKQGAGQRRMCKACRSALDARRVKGRPHGESHPAAKLTNEQGAEIYRRRKDGERLDALAREFGVSRSVISKIGRGSQRRRSVEELLAKSTMTMEAAR